MRLCGYAFKRAGGSAVRNRTNEVTSQLKEKLSGYFTIIPDLDVEGAAEMLTDDFCKVC